MRNVRLQEAERACIPLEIRDDDPLAAATRGVEELRTLVTQSIANGDKKVTDALAKIETRATEITARLDAIETRAQRPGAPGTTDEQAALEKRAFEGFIRRGREALTDVEVRTLRVADDTAGGYLAPDAFSAEVDKDLVQFSPIRQVARIGQTASGSVKIPRRTGRPTGSWVGETQTRTESEPAYGQVEVPINEIATYVDVANKLLEDSAIDVGAELSFDLAEEFGRVEGQAFISGDGINKPLGVLNATLNYTPSGDAALVTSDGLIGLMYGIQPFYRSRGIFLANGTTIAAIRKLKDGQGRYIWEPSLQLGQPETLLGRPVIEAPDMPDIGANAFPVIFGDFATCFRIYDRVALSLLRDPFSVATSGLTRFHARRRLGGQVVRTEGIRKLKISVS